MKLKLLALLLLAGSSVFAAPGVFLGVNVGVGGAYVATPPPPPVYYAPPVAVRPGFTWIGGYWYPVGPRYAWHAGYWARPPYAGAIWAGPRYYGHRYYAGHWRR